MGDLEMSEFNYYFSLKRNLDLQHVYKHNAKDVLFEVQDESPQDLNASQQVFEKKPSKKKSTKISQNDCKDVQSKILTKFEGINNEIWMMPHHFEQDYDRILNSFQYMLMKTKLYLMFENYEDALSFTFNQC